MATTQKTVDPAEVESTQLELSRDNTPDSPVVQELQRQVANAFVLYASTSSPWQSVCIN